MGERTRVRTGEGAGTTAPTSPHATPPRALEDTKTGPARFWRTKRVPIGIAIALSIVAHWLVGPFSILPGGPDIQIKDQDGDLTIPIDVMQAGLEDDPKHPDPTATATGGATVTPPLHGPGDAGLDASARDAEDDDARMLALGVDGGREGDGEAFDAAIVDASSDGEAPTDEAGIALGGADGGVAGATGRDPQAILGGAASVSAGPNNVTLFVNMAVIKSHPAASRLAPILAAIPQWKQFMAGSVIDPLRDCDWILIMGPSLADTQKDAVFVHYSTSDAIVDGAIGTISKSYVNGGPMDVGVPKVKAWKAYADHGERVFLRPSPGVAVIVPSSHATQFAKALVGNPLAPKTRPGEAMSLRALRPGGSISIIPQSISELRVWVVPRNSDGGADVYAEGDCPDDAAAATAAAEMKNTIQQKNSFGVRLVTSGLLNNVEVTSSGKLVKAHLSASREQIDAALGLVAGQVGATLPPPGGAGGASTASSAALPPPPPPPPPAP
ncbi:hypothetical protein BH09MYX1_BH09MYX1_29380 [soil metagenome]